MRLPAAIEINEHDLKVVLARSFAKQQVSDCIVQRIEGLTDAQISKAIADIFRKEKIKPKPLLVCIPRSLVTIRNLYLPSHDEAEIQQMLQLHISRIVPYQKEEVVYDYALLGVDAMNSTELILAIAHRDILKKHMNIVQGADLYIDTMSLSSCAVWERVMFAQKAETNISELYLILDADVSSTDFIICSHDHLLFTRGMTLDIEKCVRENQIMRLTGEVRQSLALFHSEETRKNPSKIFLSGAPAIQQLEQVFKQEFEIPVQYVPGRVPAGATDYTSLTAVSEMALAKNTKRITFTLPELQISKTLRDRTKDITVLGSLAIYFFAILLLFFLGMSQREQAYLQRLSQHNAAIHDSIGSMLDQYHRTELIKECLAHRKVGMILLRELIDLLPDKIAITYLAIDGSGIMTLRGQSMQLSDVFTFISSLENSKYFKDASTKYTRTKKVADREVAEFEVTLHPETPA